MTAGAVEGWGVARYRAGALVPTTDAVEDLAVTRGRHISHAPTAEAATTKTFDFHCHSHFDCHSHCHSHFHFHFDFHFHFHFDFHFHSPPSTFPNNPYLGTSQHYAK